MSFFKREIRAWGFRGFPVSSGSVNRSASATPPISLLISGKRNSELCEEKKDCLYQDSPPLI